MNEIVLSVWGMNRKKIPDHTQASSIYGSPKTSWHKRYLVLRLCTDFVIYMTAWGSAFTVPTFPVSLGLI